MSQNGERRKPRGRLSPASLLRRPVGWIIVVVGLLMVGLIATWATRSRPTVGRPDNRQQVFRDRVAEDRKHLLAGSLRVSRQADVSVGDSVVLDVRLTALTDTAAAALERGTPDVVRDFRVGGVQGASLASASGHVRIKLLSDAKAQQVIAGPGDVARWRWAISASAPGDYDLQLVVTTYQEDSDRALATLAPPATIHVTVHDTFSHRLSVMRGELIAWSGVVVALGVIFALRRPVVAFGRSRVEAAKERRRQGRDGYL
ncbi:hypothetical protein [Streptomyces sp. VRA16 Mangrove soil]|uniref:hypothetical protein n=1 Tax=Streptomyces sp. VRA16 Mangrove soil TaxID=2817434 RepID=UPI001A9DEF0A|nr:hypothetical protein [Streptomyces sp. VRA16 Mangrove soil]MBO1330702.1 hypothetical protein [Streptomyces sp. VRA16 Mangrove soil]